MRRKKGRKLGFRNDKENGEVRFTQLLSSTGLSRKIISGGQRHALFVDITPVTAAFCVKIFLVKIMLCDRVSGRVR